MMSDPRRLASVLAIAGGMFLTAAAQAQTTWYVDNGNCPGPGSGSEGDPFCKIQDGIDASASGDEVVVADGTYTGDGNRDLDYGGRNITLRSASGDPSLCVIDCQGSAANPHRWFYFHSGETNAAVVDGFTITNGYIPAEAPGIHGGAFLCWDASATINNCRFTNNFVASTGGAVMCILSSSATITNCQFLNNEQGIFANGGGAITLHGVTDALVANCVITGNTSAGGGAGI